jgi:hypothetical protein
MEESKAETKITTVYSLYNTLATNVIEYRYIIEQTTVEFQVLAEVLPPFHSNTLGTNKHADDF